MHLRWKDERMWKIGNEKFAVQIEETMGGQIGHHIVGKRMHWEHEAQA